MTWSAGQDGILIMLDDDHGVAEITQALERLQQAFIVALVQADAGLIQDVKHTGQARADLAGETNALTLATGQGSR